MGSVFFHCSAVVLLCFACTGCTVCEYARRTIIIEPDAFYWKKDKERSLAIYSRWADEIWMEESQNLPHAAGRPEYAIGFRDGFVDYVYAGGSGEPPPVPPRHLWNVDFRSEEGHQRAEDWYAGYRHGAQVARNGGFRSLATLRSSFFGTGAGTPGAYTIDNWQGGDTTMHNGWSGEELLPTPDAGPVLPPNTIEAEGTITPPPTDSPEASAPSEVPERLEPDGEPPAAIPIVPPAPRNLPSTVPRELPPPSREARRTSTSRVSVPQATADVRRPSAADVVGTAASQLAARAKPLESGDVSRSPDGVRAATPLETSMRIVGAPSAAKMPPRPLPEMSQSLPIHGPSKLATAAADFPTKIQLTAATAERRAAPVKPTSSTVRIHPGSNRLRGSSPSEFIPVKLPTDQRVPVN